MNTYPASYFFSWALTLSGAVMAVVSVLAVFLPPDMQDQPTMRLLCVLAFAAMVGFSVGCANCTAGAAMHAISNGRRVMGVLIPALLCTVGFCVTTGIGVHLGWTLMTEGLSHQALPEPWLVWAASIFIALAKPGMNWIIEGRKGIDKLDAQAAEREQEIALERARAQDRAIAAADNVRRLDPAKRRTAAGAAALAFAAGIGPPHDAAADAPMVQTDAAPVTHSPDAALTQPLAHDGAPKAAPVKRLTKREQKRLDALQKAERMLRETQLSNRAIARETGVSPSTIDRMARKLTPLAAA